MFVEKVVIPARLDSRLARLANAGIQILDKTRMTTGSRLMGRDDKWWKEIASPSTSLRIAMTVY